MVTLKVRRHDGSVHGPQRIADRGHQALSIYARRRRSHITEVENRWIDILQRCRAVNNQRLRILPGRYNDKRYVGAAFPKSAFSKVFLLAQVISVIRVKNYCCIRGVPG
ncbi:MAG: hypothetical protein HN368_07100 [Spirochaetales bacterium]|nr:hypothetical protein [Spirochaetales bacterium]